MSKPSFVVIPCEPPGLRQVRVEEGQRAGLVHEFRSALAEGPGRRPGEVELRADDPDPDRTIGLQLAEDITSGLRIICKALATRGVGVLKIEFPDEVARHMRQRMGLYGVEVFITRSPTDG